MKRREKEEAIKLRKRGWSLKEIREELGVAKSSVSVWVRDVPLSPSAQKRIKEKLTAGQLAAQEGHRRLREKKWEEAHREARTFLSGGFTQKQKAVLCALLYWCEGNKGHDGILFTNSDPEMISSFLTLFRDSFPVEEYKFRVTLHLHDYHNEEKQLKFWSRTTKIPIKQFTRPYRKPHTHKRTREGYPGCAQVRYHDAALAKLLIAISKEFAKESRPVG